jgi:DNA-binding NarL/FixJ family response regulator
LVFERDVRVARALVRFVAPLGSTLSVGGLSQALRAINEAHEWAAMILSDRSGLRVLRAARALPGLEQVPALLLLTRLDRFVLNCASCLGARVLCKPLRLKHFEAFVREVAAKPRASQIQWRPVVTTWKERYTLTFRETAIVEARLEGVTRDELILRWKIAETTFKKHEHNVLHKTGDPSMTHLEARGLREAMSLGA